MDKPAVELSRAWLLKAHSDLHTAQQIGSLSGGHLDAGIYHCDSLKAFRPTNPFWPRTIAPSFRR
jgi:hypothetical protein